MRAALLITLKDLRIRLRDRSVILMGLVVPLGLAFIFNLIFSGLSGNSRIIKLGVLDQDGGRFAQVFNQQVLTGVARQGLVSVEPESSETAARDLVGKGMLNALIVIPAGFSQAVGGGQAASMRVIGNVDSPISTTVARSIAEGYVADLNRVRLSVHTVQAGSATALSADQLNALASQAGSSTTPLAVRDVSSRTKQLDLKSFYAAGMAVFFLFFTVQFGVLSLLEERSDGTLARLLAAPISRSAILASKLITSAVLGVISMAVLVVSTTLLFGASWGNPLGVATLIVAAVLAATGIIGVVAGLARTAEEAGNWQAIIALVLGIVGGTFFPVSQTQGILSWLTFIAPQAWFMRGLGDLRGGDLSAVVIPTLAMLGFALVGGAFAISSLRRATEVWR